MRRPYSYTEQKFKVNFGDILYLASTQADWNEGDENAPGYIRNKPELVAGNNITLERDDNKITISATGTVVPDEPDVPDVPDVPDEPDVPVVPEEGVVANIINKQLPIFTGYGDDLEPHDFVVLDEATASYIEGGFYVKKQGENIVTAGYQVTFYESESGDSQIFSMPKDAVIINAYQYQPTLGQWLAMGFDETYWIYNKDTVQLIGDEEVEYTSYIYNSELWGDPIMTTEYWRFEVEV